jgi:hypothetical protein
VNNLKLHSSQNKLSTIPETTGPLYREKVNDERYYEND